MTLPVAKEDVPATIRAMLGPPALLPGEDAAIYEETLAHFAREVAPRGIIAWMLIKDLADHRLEIARYRRIRTALVRHPVDHRAEELEEEANANYEQELLVLDEIVHELREKVKAGGGADVTQDYVKIDAYAAEQRDGAAQSRNAMIAEIRSHHPTDRDLAAGLPSWIGGYQQLDRCLQAAEERFIETLHDLEDHVAGFGKTLRHVDVIEGEVLREEAV